MKEITAQQIQATVYNLFTEACICPTQDLSTALKEAHAKESVPHAKEILSQLTKNIELAKKEFIPSCQDTGMGVVFLEIGQDVHISGDLHESINEGVRQAYKDGYFRKSVLDPLTRINTKDNTPAVVHTLITKGDKLKISVMPKGFGSENMSALKMLTPAHSPKDIVDFAVKSAQNAGGNPCPPVVLGIGIGGTFEHCAFMAKQQLLRKIGSVNEDKILGAMEEEIKTKINDLKLGAMGMGGDTYCLAVHIAKFPTHISALPVAINFCCHALRHGEAIL